MKKHRRRLKKKISLGIATLCIIVAGCMALLLTPVFNITAVTVSGNKTLTADEIVRASGIVKGVNIFSVSLSAVRDRLSLVSGIDTVKVRRSLPSTIRITVTEGRPLVYVEVKGSLVGITADCKVVEVTAAPAAAPPDETAAPDGDGGGEEDAAGGETAETGGAPQEQPAPAAAGKTIIYGMGDAEYVMGREIQFADEKKAADLKALMDKFLNADPNFTSVDMSIYDNITMVYNGRLNVRLGEAKQLEYKMKLFRKIVDENLGENPDGTLDLQRQTYSPKK